MHFPISKKLMSRYLPAIGSTLLIAAAAAASSQNTQVLLIVENRLLIPLQTEIDRYRNDLLNEGIATSLEIVDCTTHPEVIKSIITNHWETENNLRGVVLIGNIRAAYAFILFIDYPNNSWTYQTAACDQYYMDLTGAFYEETCDPYHPCDQMPDSVDSCKDVHYTIDWYAGEYLVEMDESSQNCPSYDTEVWVSRIMGHNLNIDGRDEITILRQYFDVNHSVRTGSIAVADKAVLCDGIWSGDNFQNMDFTTIFSNVDSLNHCNESLYRSALTDDEGSRIIYLGVHSTSQGHYFPGEQFTIDELNGQNKTGIFYMINGCSAFQWDRFAHVDIGADTSNYIGGLYVFDKDNVSKDIGLCAIGYSVPEGFNNLNKFTNALTAQPDMTYGEAYNYWFTENRKLNKRLHSFVAVGDLTIRSSMGTASQFTTIRIEAENFDDQNGIGTSTCEETTVITDCNWGNWVKYEAIDLGLGAEQFTAKLGMDCSCTKEFEICLNSPDSDRIGTFQVTDTDNWCNLQSQSTTLTGASGVHDLYLKFKNQGTCNMDWFEITVSTLDVSNLWVGTGKTYETDFLSSGNAQYIDRSYTFTDVTPYNGLQYIRTANNDKHETDNPFLTFLVNRDVTVYIAVDLRISMPSWLSSWHNTGEVLQGGGWPSGAAVFSKEFSAGTISLGGNESQASSISMYCVIIEGM